MLRSSFTSGEWRRQVVRLSLACLCACGWLVFSSSDPAHAQSSVSVTEVQEDWELVVDTPDPNSSGPQVTCSIAPHTDDDSHYAAFELNHRTLPEFERGGMQLQVWSGAYNLSNNPFPQNQAMSTAGETVTWTMSMKLNGENLTFEVLDGDSTTWGKFGGQGYMRSSQLCDGENLNGYTPEDSIQNSGVGFASNRVHSLTLKRVRYYLSNGDVITDDAPRVVHQLQ
jgi:hypothetical protein